MCLLALLSFLLVLASSSGQPVLPVDEVDALREIATTLGKTGWDFTVDPCSQGSGWIEPGTTKDNTNSVTCSCTYDSNTVCHVTSISLKSQNLTGTLPPELVKLPYLQEIDLSRNYLNGTIPKEWGSMNLVNISFLGNRLTGPIPKELGNISTLTNLNLDYNRLTGSIPPEFGNLSSIDKLVFTSNNLTGTLPETLARLTTMKDFRISDNNFSGSIPTFIENWINIEKLIIQGSGLTGPIPSGIASLTKLTDLRISDLNGIESTFPNLINLSNPTNLILRSCNIVGELPPYIGNMNKGLKVLDLSFNKLSGPIPDTFVGLKDVDFIYLTGNSLTGPVPAWMISEGKQIDLSYNNFTSEITNCQPRQTNLFASSKGNTSGIVQCLKSSCEQMHHSLHINCGGREVVVDDKGNTPYEEDVEAGGASNFVRKTNWAFSSTGNFLDDALRDSNIVSSYSSITGQNSQLYMDARLSPLSLTYLGFCMRNGKYNVTLHFAEIVFTDDRTYASLGRRIFDVYIQENRVLKDFNIEDEAGGVNKGITRNFPANVTDNFLDIRFYWAGKGTNGVPLRGVYGPLISAISVVSLDYKPSSDGISIGAKVGIVFAVLLTVILLILGILWWNGCLRRRETLEYDLKGLDPNTGLFTLRQIKAATNNFDYSNKIGEGGFGPVYKGLLSNGTVIAVKQLSSKSKQGNREFVNEIGMISALQHPHLVKLYGCCIEGNQLLLIYEYMENNSLARALFGSEEQQLNLDWPARHKICIGLARGLAYLHEESRLKIVHRDIKATNVLLDKDLNPKISDFGLAKLDDEDNTHISTRIAGTFGYIAPEYALRGHLTDKADVYSFGVVLLEIVSGRSNSTSLGPKEDAIYLLDWAHILKEKGDLMELVDPRLLKSNFNKKEAMITINIALHCANVVASERPSMSAVVSILKGRADISEFVSDSNVSFEQIDSYEKNGEEHVMLNNDRLGKSVSMDVSWTGSSASATDLYPLPDSSYWEKR